MNKPALQPLDDGDFVRALPEGKAIVNVLLDRNGEWHLCSYYTNISKDRVEIEPFEGDAPEYFELEENLTIYILGVQEAK